MLFLAKLMRCNYVSASFKCFGLFTQKYYYRNLVTTSNHGIKCNVHNIIIDITRVIYIYMRIKIPGNTYQPISLSSFYIHNIS